MWQPLEILYIFTNLSSKLVFWKKENSFQKTQVQFLIESPKIEGAIFPHKTTLLEGNVKTNRMRSTKWTYYKGPSFATNYFILLKILLQSKNLF